MLRPSLAPRVFLAAVALLALVAGPVRADSFSPEQRDEIVKILRDALKTDPSILRDALTALQGDDARAQDSAARDLISQLGSKLIDPADAVAGNPLGNVTIVTFYDPRCPYCRKMMPELAALLQTDPNVKVVYKDWPILGTASQLESRALLAAQKQGGYFKLQDALMRSTTAPTRDSIREMADGLGLDGAVIMRDIDDPAIKARLEATMDLARQLKLQGTPALIIGPHLIGGALDASELREAVADVRAGK